MSNAVLKPEYSDVEEEFYQHYVNCEDPKYTIVDGEIVLMSPPSKNHTRIVRNLSTQIDLHIIENNKDCEVFPEHYTIPIPNSKKYYLPDLTVECKNIKTPILIIEVLSKNRDTDLNKKFDVYSKINSLREYVVIEQHIMEVKIFRRKDDWKATIYSYGSLVHFESIDFEIEIEKIYRMIEFNEDGIAYVI